MMTSVQPTNNPVPSDHPADARDNFKRIDEFVNIQADTTNPTRTGKVLDTITGISKRAGVSIIGSYADGVVINNIYEGVVFSVNGSYWRPVNPSDLPITINATAYPNPEDHVPPLNLYGDVNTETLPGYSSLSFDTLNDAMSSTLLKAGGSISIKERTTGNGGGADWNVVLLSTVTPNGDDIVQCTGVPTLALVLRASLDSGELIRSNMYGIPNGQDQSNLSNFQGKFTTRHNPAAIYPGLVGINNPTDGSVFDFANFGGQGQPGFNPIGFIFHHYTDSTMIQIDNVGQDNPILFLKNANNPVRRPDQDADFIGSGRFIECWRNEPDGMGGVSPSRWGFYMSENFELVWPQQTTGTETVRLINNVAANTPIWNFELQNSNSQQFLFRIDNDGTVPISFEWNSAAQATILNSSNHMNIRPLGDLILNPQSGIVKAQQPVRPQVYARSTLPSLTASEIGAGAYLQDGVDTYPIHWNGSSWLKVSDNTPA